MKILYFSTILFLLSAFYLNAQPKWSAQTSGTSSQLNSVYFVSSMTGWTAGNDGIIKNTIDGGTTWTTQGAGLTTQSYNGVFFRSSTLGWAVASGGKIARTQNGGTLWELKTSGTSKNLNSVYFRNDTLGWAAGSTGTILKTTNGGNSWSLQTSGTVTLLSSIFFINDTTGWTVGQTGLILHTVNGGSTWIPQISGTTNWLLSVKFTSLNTGYTVGATGTILKTNDGGTTWVTKNAAVASSFISVTFPTDSIGWAAGNSGTIYTTKNAGENWTAQTSGSSNHLESIYFPSIDNGWAVGASGTILKYSCAVPDKPVLNFPPGSIHCVGNSFTYSVIKDPKVSKYIWTFPTGWEGKSDSSSIVLKATSLAEAGSLTVTAVNECGMSLSSTMSLAKPNDVPAQPSIVSGPSVHCLGTSALYSVSNDPDVNSYSWTLPAEWAGASDSSKILVKATSNAQAGLLSVKGTNACGNSVSRTYQLSKPYDVPTPTITQLGNELKTEAQDVNYQWKRGQTLVGTNSATYSPDQNGSYKVVVSDKANGCLDSSEVFQFIITSVTDQSASVGINIFPNPATEELNVSTGDQSYSSLELSLLTLDGKEVFKQTYFENGTIKISLQTIPKGFYMIKLTGNGQVVYKKLSKE